MSLDLHFWPVNRTDAKAPDKPGVSNVGEPVRDTPTAGDSPVQWPWWRTCAIVGLMVSATVGFLMFDVAPTWKSWVALAGAPGIIVAVFMSLNDPATRMRRALIAAATAIILGLLGRHLLPGVEIYGVGVMKQPEGMGPSEAVVLVAVIAALTALAILEQRSGELASLQSPAKVRRP